MESEKSLGKFSYSKLNTYESCGFKYSLQYDQKHFIYVPSIASDYGTLVHWIYEQIARSIQIGIPIDYDKLKKDFQEINIPKNPKEKSSGVVGINELKKKYAGDYFSLDDHGMSYHTKSEMFLNEGIYSLENYMKEHPSYEIFGMEQFFSIDFEGYTLSGYIDRIFHDKDTNEYIIEDIKTKSAPFKDDECVTPLQFVIYTMALKSMVGADENSIKCQYDLPFCRIKQPAGTPGFIARGTEKLEKIFNGIAMNDKKPNASPLCYWCPFSGTNPAQPEEGKNLCPYYSLWTPKGKSREVKFKWEGMENHEIVLKKFKDQQTSSNEFLKIFDFEF